MSIAASKDDAVAEFHQCNSHTMVFTDSSSTDGKVRAATSLYIDFTHVATLWYHLGKDTEHTVFEAEGVGLILIYPGTKPLFQQQYSPTTKQ